MDMVKKSGVNPEEKCISAASEESTTHESEEIKNINDLLDLGK